MRRHLAESRTQAQRYIAEGLVELGGVPATKAATLVSEEEPLRLAEGRQPFVSRGGLKLDGALDAFGIDVTGKRVLDAGASTGGFTDCVLQRGAASVVAVDVGYGQLHWRVRNDARVSVHDRTNIRHATISELGGPFELIVADLSFISLVTVAPALASFGAEHCDYVLLVKPQFEVGRDAVGKGGIVTDPGHHLAALRSVVAGLDRVGLGVCQVVRSSIEGAKGNREFFGHARRGPVSITDMALRELTGA